MSRGQIPPDRLRASVMGEVAPSREDEMLEEAKRYHDPIFRNEAARERIRQNYAAHRAGVDDAVRQREASAQSGGDDEPVWFGPMPDGELLTDGTVRPWTDEDRRMELERRETIPKRRAQDE